jgi:leucyl aminopeptidase
VFGVSLFLLANAVADASFGSWTNSAPNLRMEWTPIPVNVHVDAISDSNTTLDTYDLLFLGMNQVGKENSTIAGSLQLARINAKYDGAIDRLLEEATNFTIGDKTAIMTYNTASGQKPQTLIIIHVGATAADARKVGTDLARTIQGGKKAKSCAILLPNQKSTREASAYVTEMTTALWVGLYKDKRFKSIKDDTDDAGNVNTIDLIVPDGNYDRETIRNAIANGRTHSAAVYLSKDIVNAPHNVLNSVSLVDTAQRLNKMYKRTLRCQILDQEECQRRGMGAYLGVARGSETPAQFIHITYRPPKSTYWSKSAPKLRRLGIIGKGLLFDTGGYNIKTSMMELMKFDCGGAAAVLGAVRAIAELEPRGVEVHFVIAACENMINERAMVPGDILTASNGKTIEVVNTDAEGRLTMADALVYVDQELDCDEILELSTLTGACMISLGTSIAGLWTNNDQLAVRLLESSARTGEKIWRMPMEADYRDALKSKVADLKNLGARYGGAIHAALFLQEFVEGDKPFAHVDMAGVVWDFKNGVPQGWGAKLITDWVCHEPLSDTE